MMIGTLNVILLIMIVIINYGISAKIPTEINVLTNASEAKGGIKGRSPGDGCLPYFTFDIGPYYEVPEAGVYDVCAWIWDEMGHDHWVDACNGQRSYVQIGNYPGFSDLWWPIGSFWSLPGCRFYIYEDDNYRGQMYLFHCLMSNHQSILFHFRYQTTTEIVPNNQYFKHDDYPSNVPGAGSMRCYCDPTMHCKPTMKKVTILDYSNKKASSDKLEVPYFVGIQYSYALEQMRSELIEVDQEFFEWLVDARISYIFKKEKAEAEGFGSEVFLQYQQRAITVTVEPGESIEVVQTVGYCGGTKVFGNKLRTKNYNKN